LRYRGRDCCLLWIAMTQTGRAAWAPHLPQSKSVERTICSIWRMRPRRLPHLLIAPRASASTSTSGRGLMIRQIIGLAMRGILFLAWIAAVIATIASKAGLMPQLDAAVKSIFWLLVLAPALLEIDARFGPWRARQ